jgi:hypothetical protein
MFYGGSISTHQVGQITTWMLLFWLSSGAPLFDLSYAFVLSVSAGKASSGRARFSQKHSHNPALGFHVVSARDVAFHELTTQNVP